MASYLIAEDTKPAAIALRIRALGRDQIADIILIGRLLTDAKSMLPHGAWLPWLRSEAHLSPASATNYINANAFTRNHKFAIVANLTPATLYRLARPSTPRATVDQIMALAKSGPVSKRDADAIFRAHRPAKATDLFTVAGIGSALLACPG